jgi:hypothetical protein
MVRDAPSALLTHEAIEAAPLEAAIAKQETAKCPIKSFRAKTG